jgi:hypothetical protein
MNPGGSPPRPVPPPPCGGRPIQPATVQRAPVPGPRVAMGGTHKPPVTRGTIPKPPVAMRGTPKPPAAMGATPKPPVAQPRMAVPAPPHRPQAAQGAIIQQKKIANLGSRVAERMAPRLVLQRQDSETYWLREEETQLPIRPNGLYNFVRVESTGPIHLSKIDGHPALAEGQAVEYAGEIVFDDGRMRFWSNASGNYMPVVTLHEQAGLPEEKFLSHDDVLRGKGRQRPNPVVTRPSPAELHAAAVEARRVATQDPQAKKPSK